MNKLSVLLIDDEESQIQSLKSFLEKRDYTVYTANDGQKGLETATKNLIDIVISDLRMPVMDGATVLKKVKELNPDIEVVITTAFGNIEDAVNLMKSGAYDYLSKPIDLDELENLLGKIREKKFLISENKKLKEQLQEKYKFDSIVTNSGAMENVLSMAARVGPSKAAVLIRGESGTGKELIARAIHFASNRKDKQFVTVNVASLSENLIESELFGHEKGSFTGAVNQRLGRFEEADGGTLFIDEVGDIPTQIQVKLLRAIQFGEIQRIGSNTSVKVDVRIVAATHRNLEEMMKENLFREDLFYRLNVVTISLPPLRERKSDIPLLINHFIEKFSAESAKNVKGITREALDKLMKYNFPGNIRELENLVERAVILCRDEYLTLQDLPSQIDAVSEKSILNPLELEEGYEAKMKAFETEMINEALKRTGGNKSAAARLLNISERHLRSRLERLNLK